MKNVMECVTQQKTCDRLIKYGKEFLGNETGELFIIHVAPRQFKFLGHSKEGEALDYLYEKAVEYGASLTVIRSDDVLQTLIEQVTKNDINQVIMGASGESGGRLNIIAQLQERLQGRAELIVLPA